MIPLACLWLVVGVLIGLAIAQHLPVGSLRPDPVDDAEADEQADRYERERWGR